MADLRDVLRGAAPTAPEFDEGALLRNIALRNRRRRFTFSAAAIAIASAVTIGLVSLPASDRHRIVVAPSSTTRADSSRSSVPSSTTTTSTTTSTTQPARAAIAPIQTSAMPTEAFVAVGSSLVAIDTHDPTNRRTLTTFPGDAGIGWITLDLTHSRVFFGVTSGCDPGVNGTYEIPLTGGSRRKIAPIGGRAAVSPDGTKIAYSVQTDGCGSRDLVVQDIASGNRRTFTGTRSIEVGGWSSDGQSLFLDAYDASTPSIYRFRPFVANAQLDAGARWDSGIAADAGGGRVAIMDWCTGQTPECVVGLRSRSDGANQPDYSFGRVNAPGQMSIDTTGQWPLIVTDNPPGQVVSFYADSKWQELAPGNAADW
ncbi:MAG TPA: hypothetical protein VL769_14480 [Acidimicrobiia bacterium]|nr:hypothetical protein [Acidimicrobiia bacterium]